MNLSISNNIKINRRNKMSSKIIINLDDKYLKDLIKNLKSDFVINMSDEEFKNKLVSFIEEKINDWIDSELYNLIIETYPDENGLNYK